MWGCVFVCVCVWKKPVLSIVSSQVNFLYYNIVVSIDTPILAIKNSTSSAQCVQYLALKL